MKFSKSEELAALMGPVELFAVREELMTYKKFLDDLSLFIDSALPRVPSRPLTTAHDIRLPPSVPSDCPTGKAALLLTPA